MIENENFRLVSIIKKSDKNYDVLNFLPRSEEHTSELQSPATARMPSSA